MTARAHEQRRPLPRSGLELPVLGLGGAAIGNLHGPVSELDAAGVLGDAWSAGMRYFDTAPLYGRGLGELRTGAFLCGRTRADYVLSSKVGWRVDPLAMPSKSVPEGALPFELSCDYSRDGALRSIEHTLIRTGISRLDIALVHDVDHSNHGGGWRDRLGEVLDGALPALADLRQAGVVGAVGIAVNNVEVCLEVIGRAEVDVLMLAGRYTLLDRSGGDALLGKCRRRGIGVIVGAPFNSGILARGASARARFNYRPADERIRAHVAAFERECRAAGVSLAAAALQFPLRHPAVVSVVPGPRNRAQLRRLLAAFSEQIPEDLWAWLPEPTPRPPPQTKE
jgi:D-threo-aldose 1-dehydrogenase